ncbi:DJ-1/PfpI family protein [Xylariaceae sp. FL0804]|nr:DJ-1/PfpI family protein [Xylariaceae sp. FL0804]
MAPKVLVVLTSHDRIPKADKPTGWYLPEFAHPFDVLAGRGVEVVTASPRGGEAPLDPGSIDKSDASSAAFLERQRPLWERTLKLSSVLPRARAGEFAALFFPGGHGPMFDLAADADVAALVRTFAADLGRPVAAVCHGPAALLSGEARELLKGREVTGFSNEEEDAMGMSDFMPFLLEDRLRRAGAVYKKAKEPFGECVLVQDGGRLITGQNPASARGVGEALAKAIGV